ncbi:MAG: NAD(P)-dependent oxidoreductase [Bacteroidales bacterium]
MEQIRIGILRETKTPPDRRVPLTPSQCRMLLDRYTGLNLVVQPSPMRCFSDEEYTGAGIRMQEDLSDCDILMGVKEVTIDSLLAGKTYLFFSHTAKKQPYNRGLLQAVVEKGITLIDYEYLTGGQGERVVAFGRWAGIVGAYNGLRADGLRENSFRLEPAHNITDLEALKKQVIGVDPGRIRILVTGGGRVAGGALEILEAAGIRGVDPSHYLKQDFQEAVYTRLDPWHYTRRKDRIAFEFDHFVAHPEAYENQLLPYATRSDLLVTCHFWDPRSPVMLTREMLAGGTVPIRTIADISCDINGPIASTIRASTIAAPFYGYDPQTGQEAEPFRKGSITVMAVDNLPGELPRDASTDFGEALTEQVLPELLGIRDTGMLLRATIAHARGLNTPFKYLQDYLRGKD